MPSTDSQTGQERSERLEARITRGQKDLFKKAAQLQGRTLSDFIVHAASEAATRVVEEHQVLSLTGEEQAVFVEALLNPPQKAPRLRAAARRHQKALDH